jgi:hypothetical protein
LGSYGIIILGISILGLLASASFISFLWCAGDNNYIWRLLALNEGMTKAVAISSMVFRTSIALQAGVATSMLSGLAIERSEILLPRLATVSMMRSSNSGPIILAWLLRPRPRKFGGIRSLLVPGLATLLALTTLSSQFTSTALLSDISLGLVTGYLNHSTVLSRLHILILFPDQPVINKHKSLEEKAPSIALSPPDSNQALVR